MKYILYFKDGFIKKFPLNKPEISIGRKSDNDIVLDFDFISRVHAIIKNGLQTIIMDTGSTNGTYVGGKLVSEAELKIGDSFNLGGIEFFLRDGDIEEFKTAKELHPVFELINKNFSNESDSKTKYRSDIYSEILKHIGLLMIKGENFSYILSQISTHTSNINGFGSLVYITKDNEDINVIFSIENFKGTMELTDIVVKKEKSIFSKLNLFASILGKKQKFYSYPVKEPEGINSAFLYFPLNSEKREEKNIERFLKTLAYELTIASHFFNNKKTMINKVNNYSVNNSEKIICANRYMKNIIDQTSKIAKSDVFILIEGESGTGKELFARLIHNKSKREKESFIAINCAAIPETLLESELFGTEKGAYTGAFEKRKGKLELASGGTLLLDEIGDMPVNLQAKLLRVLQEKEFYRVGGTVPIKIDLRIISLTNRVLSELIKEKLFRNDLYYRLVHHKISIPPLRNRREDIPLLIDFFTQKYSEQINKKIKGFSVKAFRTLTAYDWPGNVRQLENEVMRLINLVDEKENIGYDLISEEIREEKSIETEKNIFESVAKGESGSEKTFIIKMLKENGWNKSKTAAALNMTYQGLHKKMKRLGIEQTKNN